jgi:hypothetical protein
MRITTALVTAILLLLAAPQLRAADDPKLPALKAADDERVAAMTGADRARMQAVFSDDLRYAHSSGGVDTKASLTDAIVGGKTKYVSFDYQERNFTFPAPGVALMTGKANVKVVGATGENVLVLSFLAVWREEQGKWRFLAWQSARMNPPAAAATPAPAK